MSCPPKWSEIARLQKFVLAGDCVTKVEFYAESEAKQLEYWRWLSREAADIRREARVPA